MDELAGYQVISSIECSAKSRDRRPRLSALTRLISPIHFLFMRTDEGVCPYCEAFISINEGTSINSKL